jgi:hypothetical protein
MNMDNGGPTGCVGKACEYVIKDDKATCESGHTTCTRAKLLEANASGFHDARLIAATIQINQILDGIPADSGGRALSLLHTNDGSLLAWVDHNAVAPRDGVRSTADDATIAKALRLKGSAASGAGGS